MPFNRLLVSVIALSAAAITGSNLPAQILAGDNFQVGVNSSAGLIDAGFSVGLVYGQSGSGSGLDFSKLGLPGELYFPGNGQSANLDFPDRIGASAAAAAAIPETRSFAAFLALASAVFVVVHQRRRPGRAYDRDGSWRRDDGGELFTQT